MMAALMTALNSESIPELQPRAPSAALPTVVASCTYDNGVCLGLCGRVCAGPGPLQNIARGGQPCLLSHAPSGRWAAHSKWTPEFFASALPAVERVRASTSGAFVYLDSSRAWRPAAPNSSHGLVLPRVGTRCFFDVQASGCDLPPGVLLYVF
jgi:hypothetical protein